MQQGTPGVVCYQPNDGVDKLHGERLYGKELLAVSLVCGKGKRLLFFSSCRHVHTSGDGEIEAVF